MKAHCSVVAIALTFVLLASTADAGKKSTLNIYKGRVIHLAEDFCELKWNRREMIFYFSPDTKYYNRGGAEGSRSSIRICQVLRVWYRIEKGKRVLSRVRILKEGGCGTK